MATTIDSEVRGLLDRVAIHDLVCRYCDALDLRKWELLYDVFTPDVTAHWPAGTDEQGLAETDMQGSKEIVAWLQQVFEDFGPTHHLVSNLVLDGDGDVLSFVCRVRAYHAAKGRPLFEESLARFSGTARRTPDGWRVQDWRESIAIALGNPVEFAEFLQERMTGA
jgi:SnoaL-like domain